MRYSLKNSVGFLSLRIVILFFLLLLVTADHRPLAEGALSQDATVLDDEISADILDATLGEIISDVVDQVTQIVPEEINLANPLPAVEENTLEENMLEKVEGVPSPSDDETLPKGEKVLTEENIIPSGFILTPSGYRDPSDLETGDEVIGFDPDSGEQVTNTIEKIEIITPAHYNYWEQDEDGTYTNYVEIPFTFYEINEELEFFKDQSVLANGRVVHVWELALGDTIYTGEGEMVTVNSLEEKLGNEEWYKLTVSGNHTYIADNIILHNASRYWVGGGSSANWSAASNTNWGSASNTQDNASVPGSSDDVFFDGVGTGASNSTISASISINSLDMTGYANTLTHNASVTLTIAGNTLKLASGMTYTLGSNTTSVISLTSTTGTSGSPTAITTNGKTLGNTTTNGAGGYFKLQDSLTLTSTSTLTHTAGTFDANDQSVTTGLFSSSNSNTRTITMGAGTWTLAGVGTIWTTSTQTGLTLNANTSTISITDSSATTKTFTPGVNAANPLNDVTFAGSGSGTLTWSNNASTIRDFLVTNSGVAAINYPSGSVLTARNITYTGYTGTATNASTLTLSGSITFSSGMTWAGAGALSTPSDFTLNSGMTVSNTGTVTLNKTSGTQNITSNGKTLTAGITLDGVGGTFQLQDDLTIGSTKTLTLTNGIFDANDRNVSTGLFSSSNSNIRTLTMGAGTWTLTGSGTTLWTTSTATNLTLNRGNAVVSNYSGATGTRTFTQAANELTVVDINITAGTDSVALTTAGRNINFTGFSGTLTNAARTLYGGIVFSGTMTLTAGSSVTTFGATSGTHTITSNAKTIDFPLTFNGVGGAWQLGDDFTVGSTRTVTLTAGTFDANDHNVSVGLFSSSGSTARTLTVDTGTWTITGNNGTVWTTSTSTNMTFTTRPTLNFNYSGATGTRTITTGTVAESSAPTINITAGTDIVALTTNVNDLNFTGFSGSLNNGARTIYGSLTISPTMTLTAGSSATTFGATSGTKTITSNGVTLDFPVTLSGVGGTFELSDDFTVGSTRTVTLTAGTFDANDHNVSVGLFSSSGSTARTLTMGAGTWTLTGSGGTLWTTSTATNLTLNRGNAVIANYSGSTGTRTFSQAASETTVVDLDITAGTDSVAISTGARDLDFTGFAGTLTSGTRTLYGSLTISSGMTITTSSNITTFGATSGTHTITSNGNTITFPVNFNGAGGTWQLGDDLTLGSTRTLTLTAGTFDANGKNVTIGLFFGSGTNTRTLTMGAGTWTITGNNATIWHLLTATNITVNVGNPIILNYSGATGSRGIVATALGSNLQSFRVTAGTDTILGSLIDGSSAAFGDLDFTGFSGTWNPADSTIYGDLTMSSGMTVSADSTTVNFVADSGTNTLTSNGVIIHRPILFDGAGVWQLADDFASSLAVTIDGTLDAGSNDVDVGGSLVNNGDFIHSGVLTMSGSDFTNEGTLTVDSGDWDFEGAPGTRTLINNGTITHEGTNWTINGDLENDGTINAPSGNTNISGDLTNTGTFNHGNGTVVLTGGDQTLVGTTFYNFTKIVSSAATLTFPAGGTETIEGDLTLSGAAGELLSLRSSTPDTQWNIDPQGDRTLSYLDVQDSNNINETTIEAFGLNITDSENNTNWNFTTPAPEPESDPVIDSIVSGSSRAIRQVVNFIENLDQIPLPTPLVPSIKQDEKPSVLKEKISNNSSTGDKNHTENAGVEFEEQEEGLIEKNTEIQPNIPLPKPTWIAAGTLLILILFYWLRFILL